jgi:hypothetical protein
VSFRQEDWIQRELMFLVSHEKTLLLFVIRDHVGATPLANLTATLTQDMEKIWASLAKVRVLTIPHEK